MKKHLMITIEITQRIKNTDLDLEFTRSKKYVKTLEEILSSKDDISSFLTSKFRTSNVVEEALTDLKFEITIGNQEDFLDKFSRSVKITTNNKNNTSKILEVLTTVVQMCEKYR